MIKLILLGYMASGKTTIARLLPQIIPVKILDLDSVIEEKTGMSIPEIFRTKGEVWFRKTESQVLAGLLNEKNGMVLSLGGGTPCYGNNLELLNGEGIVTVYLKASVPTLYARLLASKAERPIIAGLPDGELEEFIAKHLFDRSYYYRQAMFTVNVDGKSPHSIIEEIGMLLA